MHRKKAEEFFLSIISKLPAAKKNTALYIDTFSKMSDAEFGAMMKRLKEGSFILPIFVYNMDNEKIDLDEVIEIGNGLGVKFFHHLELTDQITGDLYKTPIKYLVLDIPVRRPIQHLVKKMSAGEGKVVAHLTGQPTGISKSASISFPELTILDAKNLTNTAIEMAKVNGGDAKAHNTMIESVAATGGFSLAPILEAGTKPKASETLKSFLLGMGLRSEGLG